MDKLLVSISIEPVKTVEDIVKYASLIKDDADMLHCDIMDGSFVENKTYSFDVVKLINEKTLLPLDVHLMVNKPSKYIKDFIQSGANILTVHYEAYKNKKKMISDLKKIREMGALSGLSIKPHTEIGEIVPYLCFIDVVLIMSVEPGKSGQKFLDSSIKKVSELNKIKNDYNINLKIEVDGGITPETSTKLRENGADIVVSGNFVYKSEDKLGAIKSLR